jgi:subtilisin family serine protease
MLRCFSVRFVGFVFQSAFVVVLYGAAPGDVWAPSAGRESDWVISKESPTALPVSESPPDGAESEVARVSVFVHFDPAEDRGPTAPAAENPRRQAVKRLAREFGGRVHFEYELLPHVINLRDVPRDKIGELQRQPGVTKVEMDAEFQISLHDSISLIRGLQSQIAEAGLAADGAGVRVCIIDTGIDSDHGMFVGRIDAAAGYDFANSDPDPEDDNGHGSHVAGIVGGRTGLNVDFGCAGPEPFQGVAPSVTLIAIKVCTASGGCAASNIVAGLNRCASAALPGGPADVINLSLGGGQFAATCDGDTTAQAANNAAAAGVVVVAAAGNNGFADALTSPACGSQVISVGATYDDTFPSCESPNYDSFKFCIANFFGICLQECTDTAPPADALACFSNRNANLDVTAPGCIIYSADEAPGGNTLVGRCGTSMAAPHVAGLAALMVDLDPALTPMEVRQFIQAGAVDLGTPGFDNLFGYGRIDVLHSLELVSPGCALDGDCDDGLYCNGPETCVGGFCQNGTGPCPGQLCRESDFTCVNCLMDADCGDGLFCNGVESCGPSGECSAGTAPNCDDGVACTVDSCSDAGQQCEHVPNNALCDDGLFCNGAETCNPVSGCVAGGLPCGIGECDEEGDQCLNSSTIWLTFTSPTLVPGLGSVETQDIVAYDAAAGAWSLVFDGSDVGLTGLIIDALARLPSGGLLLSFSVATTIPTMTGGPDGSTALQDADVVQFIPTALGADTAGSFAFYFDGSDVGLTLGSEDIDAIAVAPDGRLILSTTGAVGVPGVSGADTDLLVFRPTSLGAATAGSFEVYFDGSDVALTDYGGEDVDGAALTPAGTLLLSMTGAVSVPGVSAANEDVLEFHPTAVGPTTAGTYSLFLDLSALGIHTGEDIGALEWGQ